MQFLYYMMAGCSSFIFNFIWHPAYFVVVVLLWQEIKDTLDKDSIYSCMAHCYEAALVSASSYAEQ